MEQPGKAVEPIKVPLRGGQAAHLRTLRDTAVQHQRAFEAAILTLAAEAELPAGQRWDAEPQLEGPEPHVLLTPPTRKP